jgi:ankyrin repeat protein
VRLLVLANAEINKPNALNHSPLACAIYRLADEPVSFENTQICFLIAEFLINHGADVNWIVEKGRGFSLLHLFCGIKVKMNQVQKDFNYCIVKFLLSKGADLNQKTLKDETVADLLEGHCNKIQLLTLVQEFKGKATAPKIQKHNIKRLGDDYFKL